LKVLLIGDSCEDVYHYGVCERLSPEAAVPVMREIYTETAPGMSANVLLNLKAFGIDVEHITNEHKIEKHRFIDSRYNQHLLRYDTGERATLPHLNLEKVDSDTLYDAIVISDYNKGFLRDSDCREICAAFKDTPIFVDTKKNNLTCYNNCVIKINEKEYKNITQKPNLAEFVVTLGDRGASYNDTVYHTHPVEVFDVCGAGDVFLSALVYGYLQTNSMAESIKLANKCASLSVSKMGTYVLTQDDINDLCV
tara:strand:- start:33769 stop:34524 length:756 start_codon:yes stop_codon:yes gene_type:complete